MKEKFIYNKKTCKLHIAGYCTYVTDKFKISDYEYFDTEDEALAYGGRALGMCKVCHKKREKITKEK
ncbi:MAG: hypothetical protein K2N14_01330 [Clostridia bacterium]|nr:hypothetical protein [Clostridia bacterium]